MSLRFKLKLPSDCRKFRSSRHIHERARDTATMVTMGNLRDPNTALAVFGILAIATLQAWNVRAAILAGSLLTTAVGAMAGLLHWQPQSYSWTDVTSTMFHLDIRGAMGLGLLE